MTTTGRLILKATLLIAFFNLMSKVLGLVRESVIARLFGASMYMDAYQMALKMPNMLFFIVSGALATVIIPVFTEYASRGEEQEAWKIFRTVMFVITLFFFAASVVGVIGAPLIVKMVAPGFKGATQALTIELSRIILPLMIFAGLASLFANLLNANKIFGLPAFSNSVNNVIIILAAFVLGKPYGIHGLAMGTVLAMAAMALVQCPALYKAGFRFTPAVDLKHPGVKKTYYLALPSLLSISVNQANVYIAAVLASWLPVGSVSALNFADKLIQFPVSLFVLALGTAVFPTLAGQAAGGDGEALSNTLLRSMRVIILGIVPASVGLMTLSQPIVTLIYKGGAFDQRAVEMTAAALFLYSIGLVGQAGGILLTRGFYSMQDTRTPLKLGVITVLINLGLSLALIGFLQHAGLALANSLANLAYMALLLFFLGKKVPVLRRGGLFRFTLGVLAAAVLMAATSYLVNTLLTSLVVGVTGLVIQVGLSITAGIVVFIAAIFALKIEEAGIILRYAREALSRRAGK